MINHNKAMIDFLSKILLLFHGVDHTQQLWQSWKQQYQQYYPPSLQSFRKQIFLQNLNTVITHHSHPHTYSMGLNQFSAFSPQEFEEIFLNDQSLTQHSSASHSEIISYNLQDVNWNAAGYVTGIKNTGQCGSGWAFGAVGAMEFLYKSKTGKLMSLSQQQLLDCDMNDYGCNGGFVSSALNYSRSAGITSTDSYPYTAVKGTCRKATPVLKFNSVSNALNCNDLYNSLQSRTVAVMVDARNFQFYSSGIFNNCGTQVNHGVLLVGISNNNYWYVKNQWGVSWGESGYIRVMIGNTCGICQNGAFPI